jgi:hypothetical protein
VVVAIAVALGIGYGLEADGLYIGDLHALLLSRLSIFLVG